MKRIIYIALAFLLVCFLSVFALSACGPAEPEGPIVPGVDTPGDETPGDDEPAEPLLDFVGISFENKTVDYSGNSHTIFATGVPEGATVDYTNNGPFCDVGEYVVKVTVKKTGYNDYTASATLTINPIDLTGVTFPSKTFEYDGNPHTVSVVGSLPSSASVTYSSDVSGIKNTATEIGVYNITALVTDKNHNPLTLEAVLKITTVNEERFMACASDGDLYFQNALDDNELYMYDTDSGSVVRVSGGDASSIFAYRDGVVFIDSALFISTIRTASYDGEAVSTENLYTVSGACYLQMSNKVAYYAINGLLDSSSGIYRVDLSGSEPVVSCLSVGKASYLTLVGNNIYFADGSNGGKLSRINTTSLNQTRTLVVDAKINNLIYNNGALYYTVNNLLGNYIEKYTISGGARRKLTIDAGESLTVVGDRLYYVNVDKFTTSFIGNGIYSVSTNMLVDNNNVGAQLIDGGTMGVCSLTTDGTYLYYYDLDGYKLIKYSLSGGSRVDLLDGFVKPEDPTPVNTGSKLQSYGGNIYYLDIYDGKRLYCYNPTTKESYPLTSGKVADFNIIGDNLYVNMVSWLVNNDTFTVNLRTGGSLVKINGYSAYDFVSDGTYIYYVEENAASARTAIHRCKPDGREDTIIYEYGVTNLRYINGKIYFVRGDNIHCLDLATSADTVVAVDGRDIHTSAFDTDGTYLYYRDMYGIGWLSKRLSRCKLDGTENVVMVEDIDPVSIAYIDGEVYYYSDTVSEAKNGLFKVSASVTEKTTGTGILAESSGYYAKAFAIIGDRLYFVDYKKQFVGDSHLYVITIGDDEAERLQ